MARPVLPDISKMYDHPGLEAEFRAALDRKNVDGLFFTQAQKQIFSEANIYDIFPGNLVRPISPAGYVTYYYTEPDAQTFIEDFAGGTMFYYVNDFKRKFQLVGQFLRAKLSVLGGGGVGNMVTEYDFQKYDGTVVTVRVSNTSLFITEADLNHRKRSDTARIMAGIREKAWGRRRHAILAVADATGATGNGAGAMGGAGAASPRPKPRRASRGGGRKTRKQRSTRR
jgi:hypothetical protein